MKLDDFLKCKKVRCIKGYDDCLKVGREYDVIDVSVGIKIKDDEGDFVYCEPDHFEPVIESAENSLQNIELTPEFDAVEPKFKVGDKVYCYGEAEVYTYNGMDEPEKGVVLSLCEILVNGKKYWIHPVYLCHATPENYELLCKLYPHIEFEQPPKPLSGSDLARAMLDKGWNLVPCVVSDTSDNEALLNDDCQLIDEWYNGYFECNGNRFKYAVPFDPRTGEPLTEAVLDE